MADIDLVAEQSRASLRRIHACLLLVFALVPLVVTALVNELAKSRHYSVQAELDLLQALECASLPGREQVFADAATLRELDLSKVSIVELSSGKIGGGYLKHHGEIAAKVLGELQPGPASDENFFAGLKSGISSFAKEQAASEFRWISISPWLERSSASLQRCPTKPNWLVDPMPNIVFARQDSSTAAPQLTSSYAAGMVSNTVTIKDQVQRIGQLSATVEVWRLDKLLDTEFVFRPAPQQPIPPSPFNVESFTDRPAVMGLSVEGTSAAPTAGPPWIVIDGDCKTFAGIQRLPDNSSIAFRGRAECLKTAIALRDLVFQPSEATTMLSRVDAMTVPRQQFFLDIYGGMKPDVAAEVVQRAIFNSYDDSTLFGFRVSSTAVPLFIQLTVLFILGVLFGNIEYHRRHRLEGDFASLDKIFSLLVRSPVGFIICFGFLPAAAALLATPFGFYYVELPMVILVLCMVNIMFAVLTVLRGLPVLYGHEWAKSEKSTGPVSD